MADDPRLDDLRRPELSWRERLFAAALGAR